MKAWRIHRGGFAEYALAGEEMIFEVPDSLDDVEASAIFFPYHLAYLSVQTHARLRSRETLLVHGASGGVSRGDNYCAGTGVVSSFCP